MGKYFSFGEYNKLYKYIWIYLIIRFISQFIFDYELIFDQLYYKPIILPYGPFIYLQLNYITFIIISLVLKLIEKRERKKSNPYKLLIRQQHKNVDIFGVRKKDYFLCVNLFFVVVIDIFDEISIQFQCNLLNYWMFEMFFFEIFNIKILKTNIYRHHVFALIFILSSCSIIKTISIIFNFLNETQSVSIFDGRKWLIYVAVIFYLLLHLSSAYIYCNEKYYLNKNYILIHQYLLLYGIFGFISTSICVLSSSYIPCGDNTLPELSKIICKYDENEKKYYFDNYSLYFKELSSSYLGLRIPLLIFQSILYYASNYYIYVIYKVLSPIFHICMKRLNYIILDSLAFINDLVNNKIKGLGITLSILNIIILIFYVLGSIVYLEFIELHFCGLDFYLNRNIKDRSNTENLISLDNIGDISERSSISLEDYEITS